MTKPAAETVVLDALHKIVESRLRDSLDLTTTVEQLALGSFDQIELCMEIEEAFEITLDPVELVGAKNVADIVALVEARTRGPAIPAS